MLDLGIRAIPFENVAVIVTHGLRAEQEPSIFSVVPAQACFNLTALARIQQVPPKIHESVAVFCVKRRSPAPIRCFVRREAGVIQPAPIEEFSGAVGTSGPRQSRNGVNVLRLPSLLGTLPCASHSPIYIPSPNSHPFKISRS